jgi:hypothetical protein
MVKKKKNSTQTSKIKIKPTQMSDSPSKFNLKEKLGINPTTKCKNSKIWREAWEGGGGSAGQSQIVFTK